MPPLKGFMFPRSATGRSSILPEPPWHYSGDMLTLEYRTDPDAVARLLPEPLEVADEDPGAVAIVFADWQSCSDASTNCSIRCERNTRKSSSRCERGTRTSAIRDASTSGSTRTSRWFAAITRAIRRSWDRFT